MDDAAFFRLYNQQLDATYKLGSMSSPERVAAIQAQPVDTRNIWQSIAYAMARVEKVLETAQDQRSPLSIRVGSVKKFLGGQSFPEYSEVWEGLVKAWADSPAFRKLELPQYLLFSAFLREKGVIPTPPLPKRQLPEGWGEEKFPEPGTPDFERLERQRRADAAAEAAHLSTVVFD